MFRLGCVGCLTVLVLASLLVGTIWVGFQVTRTPAIGEVATSSADGVKAQQKIFEIARRASERRPGSVTLSERELNAFLNRHLAESADQPLRNLTVRLLGDAQAEIAGVITVSQLLAMPPFSAVTALLPTGWSERPLWITLGTKVSVERTGDGRVPQRLRLDVERFWVGRLPLPVLMLRVLLDPAALRLLRWPLPEGMTGLQVQTGRVVVQTGS